MINVWILTMVLSDYNAKSITSFQLKFDSVAKCESYRKNIEKLYSSRGNVVGNYQQGICVQTQEQKN